MGVIAPKGSGKTTWIANVLDFYAGYFHTIVVFSPTLHSDEKWNYVRKRPLLGENKDLKRFLAKKQQKDNAVVGERHVVDDGNKKFDPHIPEKFFITQYDEATLAGMLDEQLEKIAEIEKLGGTKHLANRLLLIFDDMVGSSLFNSRRENRFKSLNTNHRHHSASLIMVSQGYKEIPKTPRTGFTGLILFEIPSEGELNAIYEEHPVGYKRDDWDKVYKACTEDEYAFMYINYNRPRRLRVMRNFENYVWLGDESESNIF